MKKKDIKTKTIPELKKELFEAKNNLFNLKLEKAQNKLKNLRAVFHKRKDIARLKTKIREMELAQSLKGLEKGGIQNAKSI